MESRRFTLVRHDDVTGVSGMGVVADGVRFPDGVVALRWRGGWPTSVVFHDRGMDAVVAVHGHGGSTEVVWLDSDLFTTHLDTNLGDVQHAVGNLAQSLAEGCDDKQLLADYWEVQKFVPTLLGELARLRAVVRGDAGGWSMKSVAWLVDGDIPDDDLHEWRVSLAGIDAAGSVEACAWRLFHERRGGGWPTLVHAPNGLPVLVRHSEDPCDCRANGALDGQPDGGDPRMTAGIERESAERSAARQPLRCPSCGGQIFVEHDWEGHGYLSREVVSGFWCAATGCYATWDKEGNPT